MRTPDTKALEAAAALARAIQSSAEWREVVSAQHAAKGDTRFGKMVARQEELLRNERGRPAGGQGLGAEEVVEMMALRSQIQGHELYIRQQGAWEALVGLLQGVNRVISGDLGMDFASNAAPRRGGCCG